MKRGLRSFLFMVFATLGLSALAVRLVCGGWYPHELAAGWALTVLNGAVAAGINRRAVGSSMTPFFFWSLIVHSFRIIVLILVLFLVYHHSPSSFKPLVTATLVGYFSLLWGEIRSLCRMTEGQ